MAWHWTRGKPQPVNTRWDRPPVQQPDFRLEALYAWERRCRGYELFPEPVELEPQFAPYVANLPLSRAGWDRIPQPRFTEPEALMALPVLLPAGEKVTAAQANALFAAWRGLSSPLSLEIIATSHRITYQAVVAASHAPLATAAFASPLPGAQLEVGEDALQEALRPLLDYQLGYRVVDWGLYHAAYLPLRLWDSLAATPHHALLGQLGSLRPGVIAGIQVLVQPAAAPWGHSLVGLVGQFEGGQGKTKDEDLESILRLKLASPLWAVAVRVFAAVAGEPQGVSPSSLSEAAFDWCRHIGGTLDALGNPDPRGLPANALVALEDSGYPSQEHLRDVLRRRSRRTGMLLSQAELLGLWHPPTEQLNHPKLWRYDASRRELPEELRQARGVYLGTLARPEAASEPISSTPVLVPWPDSFRNRHAYLLGATRMGKSTLLLNLIAQDLLAGRGLCLIDPHGDLALDVLDRIPPEREKDVLFLDLSDTAYPPAIGLLETADEWEQQLLVSDLLAILHRLFRASWGDRLEHILRHALLTLLADTEKHTLRDIRPLLANEPYRQRVVGRLPDADLRAFWNSEFPSYSAAAFAPIYNKLGLLMSSPTVRNIISGQESRLHPGAVIQDKRILIVNLAQSLIGEDNAHFLGALFVTKIQLAAMHNLRRGRGERTEFTLYVDEFQNFVVSSFESILSEAGKAGLSLVMANQFLEQLGDGLQTAILSNVGTLVSFRVSAESGRRLASEFGGFYGADTLTDLKRGQAVVRLGRAGDSYAIRTFPPVDPAVLQAEPSTRDAVVDRTRAEVCRPRSEVEAEFRAAESVVEGLLSQDAAGGKRAKPKTPSGRTSGQARSVTDTPPDCASLDSFTGNGVEEPEANLGAGTSIAGKPEASGATFQPARGETGDRSAEPDAAPPTPAQAENAAPAPATGQAEAAGAKSGPPPKSAEQSAPPTNSPAILPAAPAFFGLSEDELPPASREVPSP